MSAPDYYYYQAVSKHRTAELQARAEQEHLAKIARQAAKKQRAARREARRLQVAVDGRQTGLLHVLRTLFAARPAGVVDPQVAAPQETVADPIEEASQQPVPDRTPVSS